VPLKHLLLMAIILLLIIIIISSISSSSCKDYAVWFFFVFFYYLVYEAIGTAATPGLLCQPLVIVRMIVKKQMECRFAEETEVFGENLPQRHFCPSQNSTWPDPGLNPGRRAWKPATNRLSYGAALAVCYRSISYS
jgi:hypothetical protein